ncbi:MAG: type IV secretory system conjugative DNA transfer family protein [Clostridia bacterium]|nr:type IV secretory system conjugative DNA transfer family protein [Clostridia bacterium]
MVFICLSPVVVWFALIIAGCYQEGNKLFELLERITIALENPMKITFNEYSLKTVLIFLFFYVMGIGVYFSSRENRRPGEEHGSAKWGVVSQIAKKYADHEEKFNNLIFSHTMRIGLNAKKHRRNLNVLVVGGSGAGKTRFYAKPNIMQCNTSFIIADPKGEMLRSVAPLLLEKGYDVKVFNLITPQNSDGYNPFTYIRTDEDVMRLITNLIQNTTPKNAQQNDPFWEKSEIALDTALMLYLLHEAPPDEQNFEMLMFLIENATAMEDDEEYKSPVDQLFDALENENREHIAVKQWKIFKQASGKTAKSILISAAVRLAAFNLPEIARMTSYDNLDLGSMGEKKKAIFCVIPDNDNSFNYLVGMLYTQAFQELYYRADHNYGGELPIPVHFVMDEFANVALPDNFERLLATMRSRRISVSIIIQNMAQLKALFKDSWESLVGNCDTMLYLGGNEQSTHEYISKMLGKETIDTRTRGITRGSHGSSNTNYQNTGRELLTLDEVRLLDNSNALIFVRGEKPIVDKKYDILSHPNIKLTADGGAVPYTHNKQGKYFKESLSFEVDEIVDVSEIVIDSKEGDFVSNKRNEVMNTQTNGDGVAVFYTVLEGRTDDEGKAEVSKYVVTVTNTLKETKPIKNLLVKYIPEVLDKDRKIVTEREIRVIADEPDTVPKGGKIQISVFDNESRQYVQNIKVRFITDIKKTEEAPKVEPKTEPKEEKQPQPQKKQIKDYLLNLFKKSN